MLCPRIKVTVAYEFGGVGGFLTVGGIDLQVGENGLAII